MPIFRVVQRHQRIQLIRQDFAPVHQSDCTGVTNLKLVTTGQGRKLRDSSSIGHSLSGGVSAQTTVITLSGWSGAWRWWSVYPTWSPTTPANHQRHAQRKLRAIYFQSQSFPAEQVAGRKK
ncbi:hypothetical protein ACFQHW_09635 [Lapidilactobacillus achengensis]|uniref:Uncharacterized protein n=1 Tax=Lapidilactobacillus achengensis TaxID=2486000 RepID=A0ABW1UQ44_9LACO|nr:hypothetical protein [Lapidilactobacillus achengensis]